MAKALNTTQYFVVWGVLELFKQFGESRVFKTIDTHSFYIVIRATPQSVVEYVVTGRGPIFL